MSENIKSRMEVPAPFEKELEWPTEAEEAAEERSYAEAYAACKNAAFLFRQLTEEELVEFVHDFQEKVAERLAKEEI